MANVTPTITEYSQKNKQVTSTMGNKNPTHVKCSSAKGHSTS